MAASGGVGQFGGERGGEIGGGRILFGKNLKGKGEQGIPRKQGGRDVELNMACGLSAPHGAVVDAGKVVVYEGIGVEAFHGNGCGERVGAEVEKFARGKQEHRPDAFAARVHGIAHGGVQSFRSRDGSGQDAVDAGFHLFPILLQFFF